MYKHLLIATDGSQLADKGVAQGFALAKALQAEVTLITVSEPWATVVSGEAAMAFSQDRYGEAMAANAGSILGAAADTAEKDGIPYETRYVSDRFPAEAIVEVANEEGCDLIVMASHGRRGIQRLLLGSQTNEVITHSTIPVLVCR